MFSPPELNNKGICDTQSVRNSLRHGDSMIIETLLGNWWNPCQVIKLILKASYRLIKETISCQHIHKHKEKDTRIDTDLAKDRHTDRDSEKDRNAK